MYEEPELKKLYWHSRRGMLELDLLLVPFAENKLMDITEKQLGLYERFLAEEDQDMFQWLVKRKEAPDSDLQEIVDLILAINDEKNGQVS